MVNKDAWAQLNSELSAKNVTLIAVSKTRPAADIQALYQLGQRDFGENYVQELAEKQPQLPGDIHWHFIGHLQSNKVKFIAPFIHLIHTVDSFKLLTEISRQAAKNNRTIDVLLQLYIANEETKFGLDEKEIISLLDQYEAQKNDLKNVRICGLMGMATNTDNEQQVRAEFSKLHNFFIFLKDTSFFAQPYFKLCSMGMSADYKTAITEGSNMVRIGSLLFGERG
jgi:PLP dependent protein